MTERRLLTIPEAARMLHVSRTTMYRLIHERDILTVKVEGHHRRIDSKDLWDYIERNKR